MSGNFIDGGIAAGEKNQDKIRERTQEIARRRQPRPLGEELGEWLMLDAANQSANWGGYNYDRDRLELGEVA
ncbi:MAG: hypothetical protein H6861_03160 [Rhodospirillales bacterium]|nr:hypothetical protein [Rhodospirillales bacterium]